jgi:hypothetical protein
MLIYAPHVSTSRVNLQKPHLESLKYVGLICKIRRVVW